MAAWREAGFRVAGHVVFRKTYASSTRYLKSQHEQAYLLARGGVAFPASPLPDVIVCTGNRLHPTQKPVPFIEMFCNVGGLVLAPFCGSGSTLVAANDCGRRYIGIELEERHCETAKLRLNS